MVNASTLPEIAQQIVQITGLVSSSISMDFRSNFVRCTIQFAVLCVDAMKVILEIIVV